MTAPAGATVLDADGAIVCPGLVDLHTHLREPGGEDAETIETGARAGALGGYTALVAMPNTEPADRQRGGGGAGPAPGRIAPCHVVSSACITKGRAGEELAPLGELHGLGVRIFTDDGTCVADAGLMRRALEYARALPGAVLAQHCEDPPLARGGHMHEGAWSSRLGIPGMPAEAESVVVARDIALAGLTGGRVHFLHLSTATSIELVRAAKAKGLAVTAEAAPHHFTLTDRCAAAIDPIFKVNPPLRTERRRRRRSRTVWPTAPSTPSPPTTPRTPPRRRSVRSTRRPPGCSASRPPWPSPSPSWSAPACSTCPEALALLSWQPAHLAGLSEHGGPIAAGRPANLCVFDPEAVWEVDPTRLASRSRNTPYAGRKLTGRVRHTLLAGEPVVIDGQAQRDALPPANWRS